MFAVRCPSCKTKMSVRPHLAGGQVLCPGCKQKLAVPSADKLLPTAAGDRRPNPSRTAASSQARAVWWITSPDGRKVGPVPWAQIDRWISDGRLRPESPVLQKGWTQWRRAGDVFSRLESQTTQPGAMATDSTSVGGVFDELEPLGTSDLLEQELASAATGSSAAPLDTGTRGPLQAPGSMRGATRTARGKEGFWARCNKRAKAPLPPKPDSDPVWPLKALLLLGLALVAFAALVLNIEGIPVDQVGVGLTFFFLGTLCLAASLFQWRWYFETRKVRGFVGLFGYQGARLFYGLLGLFFCGLTITIYAGGVVVRDRDSSLNRPSPVTRPVPTREESHQLRAPRRPGPYRPGAGFIGNED